MSKINALEDSPDKLRDVVLKFNEQKAFDEIIFAPKTQKITSIGFLLPDDSEKFNEVTCVPSLMEAKRSFNL